MKNGLKHGDDVLLSDIRSIIYQTKETVSKIITSNVATMYWKIENRINSEILGNQRAEYGKQIVAMLWRQLSGSHFKILIPIKDELERNFYTQMCNIENWSVDTLRKKTNS